MHFSEFNAPARLVRRLLTVTAHIMGTILPALIVILQAGNYTAHHHAFLKT